jgi:Polysaccharide pyruvyl transferase
LTKALVAGWFSFEAMGATAGDLIARDLACQWLAEAGRHSDVAVAPPFEGGVDWRTVDPDEYAEVVFVCGPLGNGWPVTEFLERFARRRLVGLNLSMLEPLDVWNPFELLVERDSSRTARADISFGAKPRRVPVIGVVLVHPQKEYEGGLHERVGQRVEALLSQREAARVAIDTRLDENATGLRTPAEVESVIARMDVVVTTRLHGMALALKAGVPPLVIDPIAGGAKVNRQADAIGWPVVFSGDKIAGDELEQALDYCLTEEARTLAGECRDRASHRVRATHAEFVSALIGSEQPALG